METEKKSNRWSHDERSMLRYWTSCDMSLQEISERLGRSERAIIHFCERNGYETPGNYCHTWTENEEMWMKEYLRSGQSLSNLGLPYTTVRNKLYRIYGTTSEKKAAEIEQSRYDKAWEEWREAQHIGVVDWEGDD